MPVSIYDIAKRAGVSPSTVSRALEDHPRIGAATRKRIQELAREMDFVPSTIAKSLAASKTWTIGFVLATISDPFMGRVVEGVEQVAREAGFNVFMSTSQNDREREIEVIETFRKRRVDGIIVMVSHLFERYPSFYENSQIPIVLIDDQDPDEHMHSISVDDVHGMHLAMEHLFALGHRRIGYVGVTNRPKSNQYRFKGYQEALTEVGITLDTDLTCISAGIEDHVGVGEICLQQLRAAGATAVCCYNDTVALGLLAACYKHGVAVPRDLSIMGFDDITMAAYAIPPLTTIHQPRFELGQQAMQMMLALLDGQQPQNQVIFSDLVVRQTTAQILSSTD